MNKRRRWANKPALTGVLIVLSLLAFTNRWRVFEPRVANISGNPTFDVTDPRKVVGRSSNVWFGRVLERQGTYRLDPRYRFAETQFRVRVLETLKGNLSGEVLVRQPGWLDKTRNTVHLMENDPLLEQGEAVLFLTITLQKDGVTYQSIGYGKYLDIRVPDDGARDALREQYRRAKAEQITVDDERRVRDRPPGR